MDLPTNKCLYTYRNGLLQSLVSDNLGERCKVDSVLTYLFNFLEPSPNASISHSKSLEFDLFRLNIGYVISQQHKIDISYNLIMYIQYKHVQKLFEVVCLHLHTVITLYRLDGNKKLLKIFAYASNTRAFYRPELNL